MPQKKRNKAREERIAMEIIVDANDSEEQAMGWYCYLEEKLNFPFLSRCTAERATSPLRKGDEVQVVGMAPEDECPHEIFVEIQRARKKLAVPLAQLEAVGADHDTQEGIEDWHYWINRGYEY